MSSFIGRLTVSVDVGIGSFGQIPLKAIASGKPDPGSGDLADEYQRYWAGESRKFAAKSDRGQFLLALNSSHHLHVDEPDLVVETILSVVRGATGTPTPI